MIRFKKLTNNKKIVYGFFGSKGGVSKGIYKSLNCGIGSKDKKNNIKKNIKIVLNKIKSKSKKVYLPKQVHSNKFHFIQKTTNRKRVECDAIITKQTNTPIGVLTADCIPIILYDPKIEMISAIHAGWRGAFSGIVKNVVNFFVKKGSKKKNIEIIAGPCISQKNYEVKEDFIKKFLIKDRKNKVFFKYKKNKVFF